MSVKNKILSVQNRFWLYKILIWLYKIWFWVHNLWFWEYKSQWQSWYWYEFNPQTVINVSYSCDYYTCLVFCFRSMLYLPEWRRIQLGQLSVTAVTPCSSPARNPVSSVLCQLLHQDGPEWRFVYQNGPITIKHIFARS